MKTKTIISKQNLFIICLFSSLYGNLAAQKLSLQGDTIYVNDKVRVTVEFPSAIYGEPQLVGEASSYKIVKKLNSVFITAAAEDVKPVSAIISEGKRDHSIVICYKKGLKPDKDDYYDFSTPKKLEDSINRSKERRRVQALANNTTPAITNQALTTSAEEVKTQVNALIKDGDAALKTDDLDKAEKVFTEVIKLDNSNAYAKKSMGDITEKRVQKKRLLINQYKSAGKKDYEDQNFAEAINQYKKVLELDSRDLFALGQIEEIRRKIDEVETSKKQNQERQAQIDKLNKINGYKATAAKALTERRFDDATKAYQDALALNVEDEFSLNKIKEIEKIKAKEKDNEGFISLVDNGDKAVANGEFELALSYYVSAKKIKSGDIELDKKIATVNGKIIIKDNEDKYQAAIIAGDEAKKAGEYERARTEYTKAINFFKDRAYPATQITEINEILNRQNKLKKVNADYVTAVEKAENALAKKDIANARSFFKIAADLKAEEAYPKVKLAELDSLENAKKVDKDYTIVMQKAKVAFDKKDYVSAKEAYTKAHAYKPMEDEPTNAIELIDGKINEKAINIEYDSSMARGNVAAGERNYALALANYKEALRLKPLEALALSQVQFARNMIIQDSIQEVNAQKKAIAIVKEELRKKRFSEGMAYYDAYDKAAQISDYENEVYYLKKFLDIFPDESEFNEYQYTKKISDSKKKINDIRNYWSRTNKFYQPDIDSVPYLAQDFEKKYPEINYSRIRNEQIMVALDTLRVGDAIRITKELVAEKPHLFFSDSVSNIKIISEGIRFINEKAYYKIRIRNSDSSDFLTGTMALIHIKKDGSITKNYPDYISCFPIVSPEKEFCIVYSTKDLDVKDDESIAFEMNDRLKKVKLSISIPGKAYNDEKKLKL